MQRLLKKSLLIAWEETLLADWWRAWHYAPFTNPNPLRSDGRNVCCHILSRRSPPELRSELRCSFPRLLRSHSFCCFSPRLSGLHGSMASKQVSPRWVSIL